MPPLPPTKYPQSKYEKLRDENIERNRRLLEALIAKDRYGLVSPFDPVTRANLRAGVSDAGYLRGTKRSATVADERSEDQGEDNEPESQKSVSTVERRVRFPSQTLSRPPKRRQRVDDGLDNAETAPDELWVAKGEVRLFNNFRFSRTLTLLAGQVQTVQTGGEGGLSTTAECKWVLQVLHFLRKRNLAVQPP